MTTERRGSAELGERWDDRVREAYVRPLAGEEAARGRTLTRLRRELVATRSWWLDPESLRVPPLAAAAAAVVVLALGAWAGARWAGDRHVRATTLATGEAPRIATVRPATTATAASTTVTFAFRAPGATRVALVGDFNGWDADATPLRRAATGDVWTVDLPLPRGLHAYAFIVDGADWSVDPSAPLAPETTFGRRNALLVVDEKGAL